MVGPVDLAAVEQLRDLVAGQRLVLEQRLGEQVELFLATGLVPPVHIYKQLRGAYGLSRFSALWRTIVLMVFVTIILLLFLNLLLLLGALG